MRSSIPAFALCFLSASLLGAEKQSKCPISGGPVKSETTVEVNGQRIGFCCDGCPEKFVKEQLGVAPAPGKCPYSGEQGKEETRLLHAQMVYFCCDKCAGRFATENHFRADRAPNAKCPLSGKPVNEECRLLVNGSPVRFCCGNCRKAYKELLRVADKGPGKCPISGEPARAETGQLFVKALTFCCPKCRARYARENFPAAERRRVRV